MRYFFATLLLSALGAAAIEPVRLAVVQEGDPSETSSYARTVVEGELSKSPRIVLVERGRVDQVLEELSFQSSGVTEPATAARIGRQLNVAKIAFVRTHRIYPDYRLGVRVVDVASGRVERVEEEDLGRDAAGIEAGARRAARRLVAAALLLAPAEMVPVLAGTLRMGSAHGLPDEAPPHDVALGAFFLDRHEVSRAAFDKFRAGQGQVQQTDPGRADHPAVLVNWHQADAYCRSLGKRLPTEAEWEYAARGQAGRTYPWGNEPPSPSRARFSGHGSESGPLPVDSLPTGATPEGIHHLAGNAAEWVSDWWHPGYYALSPPSNPSGPQEGDYKVVRGGSWDQPAEDLRATARAYHNPDKGAAHIGFRCARDVPPPE